MLYPHFRISIITEKSYTKINVVIQEKMSEFRYVGRLRRYGYLLIFKIAAVRNLRFLVREKHVSVWITARDTFNSIHFVG